MRGLSLVAASGGHSSSRCAGLSLSWPLLLRSTGSRRAVSVVVAHGPSYSAACGIFPDQGSNPCALHWQADSQRLCHQGSPHHLVLKVPQVTVKPRLGPHNGLQPFPTPCQFSGLIATAPSPLILHPPVGLCAHQAHYHFVLGILFPIPA